MLFNTYVFLFAFLPVTVLGFWTLARLAGRRTSLAWLVLCSLFYYSYWNPIYLVLILSSVTFNFVVGRILAKSEEPSTRRKWITGFGIAANVGLLGYFKYANFFVDSINFLFDTSAYLAPIVLPLAISFFTFQQIAYLVDSYKGIVKEHNFIDYCLFVTFFPQLITGPIVHHAKMMPQFSRQFDTSFNVADFASGLTLFFIGLAKKVLVADRLAEFTNPIYADAFQGMHVSFIDAWIAPTSFACQIYFDFSGYSDMAIGLGLLFGIRLPINFNSPYKSTNLAELWRRWHCTLSQFLRDYIYIPLGGNRQGLPRHYANLMITMVISGVWHGAGWTFVVFGFQQGFFLWAYLTWTFVRARLGISESGGRLRLATAVVLTHLTWVIGMVLFRADSIGASATIYHAMFGLNGISLSSVLDLEQVAVLFTVCYAIVWGTPNAAQIMSAAKPVVDWEQTSRQFLPVWNRLTFLIWRPRPAYAVAMALVAAYSIISMEQVREFLYYQF